MTDPLAAFGTMPTTLHDKTGRTLEEWQVVVRDLGLIKHGEILAVLKRDHGLGHGYANMLALLATGYGTAGQDELLAGLFAGPRAGLRPIYERIEAAVTAFGDDIEVLPKKTMIGFKRTRQFACFIPASASRVDLGIALKDAAPANPRVKATPGGMTSHVVGVTSPEQVDDDVVSWLRIAYDRG